MYYIIYKTTNQLDKKYYIGCHQTLNLNDGYMGSGKHLKRAIKKYGKENFKKTILHLLPTKQDMFIMEKHIVDKNLVSDSLSYNLKIGGSGGNPGIVGAFAGRIHSAETKEKIRQSALKQATSPEKRLKLSKNNAMRDNAETRNKVSKALTGRTCSQDHIAKVSRANLGKTLINNSSIAKRIDKNELPYYESLGWKKGAMPRQNKG
jgi:hypothetical protein